jgi:hypothetical protein
VAGIALILGALAFLATLAQADASANGNELSVRASVRAGLSRFWAFVGLSLLTALITIGVDARHLLWRPHRRAGLCRSDRRPF